MNRVNLIGRLTKDTTLRRTPQGTANVTFTLAVNRRYKKDGQQEADFIQCVAWDKLAELINQYFSKGSQIGIDGRIQTRSYENNQGQRVYVTEVIVENIDFLDSKKQNAQQNTNNEVSNTSEMVSDFDFGELEF